MLELIITLDQLLEGLPCPLNQFVATDQVAITTAFKGYGSGGVYPGGICHIGEHSIVSRYYINSFCSATFIKLPVAFEAGIIA